MFVHIPKTAGRSIAKALYDQRSTHIPAARFRAYDPTAWGDYFTFTIVRNPWARFVSSFSHYKQSRQAGGTAADPWIERYIDPFADVNAFCDWIAKSRRNRRRILASTHYTPQYQWISDRGGILVNYVGRFEELDVAWEHISAAARIDAPMPAVGRTGATVTLSRASVDTIGRLYAHDIEQFHYEAPPAHLVTSA